MEDLVAQAVGYLAVAGFGLLAYLHGRRSLLRRRQFTLLRVQARLGSKSRPDNLAEVVGALDGLPARFRFVTQPWAARDLYWSEAECELPRSHLAPQIPARMSEGRYLGSDFTDAYIVEGAPADVIRALLTEAVQKALFAVRPVTVWLQDNRLRMEWLGWDEDPKRPIAALETLALVASRIGPAFADLDAGVAPEGQPFRGDIAAPLMERQRERDAEPVKVVDLKRRH